MSLLSKYYYRKFMISTLSERANSPKEEQIYNIVNEVSKIRSLLSNINETYESAAQGFFAKSGEVFIN